MDVVEHPAERALREHVERYAADRGISYAQAAVEGPYKDREIQKLYRAAVQERLHRLRPGS